jgi:DNA-binding transcriptional ArsR family regulator
VTARDIRDPGTLRALAHPVRLRLLDELIAAGTATATELAQRVGESPANCSWHLRRLARYGFVAEAGGGRGRQRPWRVVVQLTHLNPGPGPGPGPGAGPGTGGAGGPERDGSADVTAELLLAGEFDRLRRWLAVKRAEPAAEWRSAAFAAQSVAWLTAAELRALAAEVEALLIRYAERADPARRPPGTRPVRLVSWGVPAVSGPGGLRGDLGEPLLDLDDRGVREG